MSEFTFISEPCKLIVFYGYKGSGKTTAAQILAQRYGFEVIKFADGLKGMLYRLGLTQEQIDGDQKEVPCDLLCGKTPRFAMQTLGTEWGRALIGENIWVTAWRKDVMNWFEDDICDVVNDDMRYPNEAAAVKELGGILVRINRGEPPNDPHVSESHYDSFVPDYTIENNGTLEDLHNAVSDILLKITPWRDKVDYVPDPYAGI